jgi:hypothetical protein
MRSSGEKSNCGNRHGDDYKSCSAAPETAQQSEGHRMSGNANSGRRANPIDRDKIAELASKGHTNAEIALECGVSERTLRNRGRVELDRGRTRRDGSIRSKQFEIAMGGNPTMLIWLGKVLLGQVERHELTGAGGGPIQYERADLRQLSDTELDELAKLVDKACEETRGPQTKTDGVVPTEKTEQAPGQPQRD